MIRECNIDDIDLINQLGLLVNKNFISVYNIKDILDRDYECIYIYEENNTILGFIHIEKHFEVIDLINIAVSESSRRKGIASKLIQYVLDTIDHENFLLEVNSNNDSAIELYRKFNFKEINIRKKYYDDGDAIVMERRKL
ncbi:MAG: GNAT family N-acetyltransferase [Bacilli bacterium]|nr:GNAT family N-acetyltransferase [Bacilli bacterium]